jgi:hypothetical protein
VDEDFRELGGCWLPWLLAGSVLLIVVILLVR